MSDFLSHPLVVLFVGAIITGLLIPWLTRQWQDRQKELEIKTKLVSDISESTMTILKRIEAVRVTKTWLPRRKSDDDTDTKYNGIRKQYREAYEAMNSAAHEFAVRSAVIGTNLEAYLPNSEIPQKWSDFADIVYRFYALEGIYETEKRKKYEQNLRQELSSLVNDEIDAQKGWVEIRDRILEVKADLIQNVLKSSISVFSRSSFLKK